MMGQATWLEKSGIAYEMLPIQPKVLLTDCFGHSLSLTVQDLTSLCKVLGNVIGTVGEINFPPKEKKS